jgi:putative membrane protein
MRIWKIPLIIWVVALILTIASGFFLDVRFDINPIIQWAIAIIFGGTLLATAHKGLPQFFLTLLIGPTTFSALTCGFATAPIATSPLGLPFILGPEIIFILTAIITFGALIWYQYSTSSNRFAHILFWVFVINWVVLAFNVSYFDDWKMENYLTIPFIIIIYVTHRWFRLSNLSYGLIFLYMMLHIYGSHYTYSEVPFGYWLDHTFELGRNHYDRIVHFSFGFLLAYPIREMIIRISNVKGFWGLYSPIEFVLAFSAIYEIIEWAVAVIYGGDLGIAYLGTQGDVFDAIKDMALAGLGSVITMAVVAIIHFWYKPKDFWQECWNSLKVKKHTPLGEEMLDKIMK